MSYIEYLLDSFTDLLLTGAYVLRISRMYWISPDYVLDEKKNARSGASADDATVKRAASTRFFSPSSNSSDGFENLRCTTKHLNDRSVNGVIEFRVANNFLSTATTIDD